MTLPLCYSGERVSLLLVEHWEGLFEASFAVTHARESRSYLLVEHYECLFEAPFAVTQARESLLLIGRALGEFV